MNKGLSVFFMIVLVGMFHLQAKTLNQYCKAIGSKGALFETRSRVINGYLRAHCINVPDSEFHCCVNKKGKGYWDFIHNKCQYYESHRGCYDSTRLFSDSVK